jgi:quinol monooxygenase YgiN
MHSASTSRRVDRAASIEVCQNGVDHGRSFQGARMTQSSATSSDGRPVHVSAVITGVPGSGDRLEEMLVELAAGTHAEAGCLLYSLQRAVENPDQFVTVEKWTSKAALDEHLTSPHVQAALAGAGEILAGPPMIIPTLPIEAGEPSKTTY